VRPPTPASRCARSADNAAGIAIVSECPWLSPTLGLSTGDEPSPSPSPVCKVISFQYTRPGPGTQPRPPIGRDMDPETCQEPITPSCCRRKSRHTSVSVSVSVSPCPSPMPVTGTVMAPATLTQNKGFLNHAFFLDRINRINRIEGKSGIPVDRVDPVKKLGGFPPRIHCVRSLQPGDGQRKMGGRSWKDSSHVGTGTENGNL